MRARLEHDLAATNGPFDPPVHGDAFGFYAAIDDRLRRNEKEPAAHFAFDMTVDLDQALGRYVSFDLQAFCNDGFSTPEKDELPPVGSKTHFCRSCA